MLLDHASQEREIGDAQGGRTQYGNRLLAAAINAAARVIAASGAEASGLGRIGASDGSLAGASRDVLGEVEMHGSAGFGQCQCDRLV